MLASGALLDVDLADAPTASIARGRIAVAVGVPIGRVRLLVSSAQTQFDDADLIVDDVQVVLLTLDPELERAALMELLHAAGVADLDGLMELHTIAIHEPLPMLTALPEVVGCALCRSKTIF